MPRKFHVDAVDDLAGLEFVLKRGVRFTLSCAGPAECANIEVPSAYRTLAKLSRSE